MEMQGGYGGHPGLHPVHYATFATLTTLAAFLSHLPALAIVPPIEAANLKREEIDATNHIKLPEQINCLKESVAYLGQEAENHPLPETFRAQGPLKIEQIQMHHLFEQVIKFLEGEIIALQLAGRGAGDSSHDLLANKLKRDRDQREVRIKLMIKHLSGIKTNRGALAELGGHIRDKHQPHLYGDLGAFATLVQHFEMGEVVADELESIHSKARVFLSGSSAPDYDF